MTALGVTWLFVPGDRSDRFARAAASGADEVILDLEDAVAAERKDAARKEVAAWLRENVGWVRVNAAGTAWHADDLRALVGAPGLRGLVLPKAEGADDLGAIADAGLGGRPSVLALVESAAGLAGARETARADCVVGLAFGSIDFAVDLGAHESRESLLLARSELVLASRLAGLPAPVDGVTTDVRDPERAGDDASYAAALGFGGKLCIHPDQIRPVAAAFEPTPAEIAWATEVLRAAEVTSSGAFQVLDGMVDRPVVLRAQRLIDRVEGGR